MTHPHLFATLRRHPIVICGLHLFLFQQMFHDSFSLNPCGRVQDPSCGTDWMQMRPTTLTQRLLNSPYLLTRAWSCPSGCVLSDVTSAETTNLVVTLHELEHGYPYALEIRHQAAATPNVDFRSENLESVPPIHVPVLRADELIFLNRTIDVQCLSSWPSFPALHFLRSYRCFRFYSSLSANECST